VPRLFIVTVLFFALGCSGPSGSPPDASAAGPDASAGLDAAIPPDASAGLDAAMPPDADLEYDAGPVCTSQADCGDPVNDLVANVCVGAHCRTPGPLVSIEFVSSYGTSLTQAGSQPRVQLTRLILGKHLDGTSVTCADLAQRSGATQATRSLLDKDPQINQAYRGLTALTWTGTPQGQVSFRIFGDVPRGDGNVLYAEAWYGQRDQNDPTGDRAAVSCTEGADLLAAPDGARFVVAFGP